MKVELKVVWDVLSSDLTITGFRIPVIYLEGKKKKNILNIYPPIFDSIFKLV